MVNKQFQIRDTKKSCLMKNYAQKMPTTEYTSFEKAVINNFQDSLQKHLSNNKISQSQLNHAIFLCLENYKVDENSQWCLLLLLRHKANPNCEVNGETPLVAACRTGQLELVKLLIDFGAKPDLPNKNAEYPLEVVLTARRQNHDVASYLINALPSVNLEFKTELSPLVLAVSREFHKIFGMLINRGACLTFQHENILHRICKKKFRTLTVMKKFIKELAGRTFLIIEDSQGKIPFEYVENQEIKNYCFEQFKPKISSQKLTLSDSTSNFFSGSKDQQKTHHITKEPSAFELSKEKENVAGKIKKNSKQEDTSFQEIDDQDQQEQKLPELQEAEKIIEVIEEQEQKCDQQTKRCSGQKNANSAAKSILNNSSFISNGSSHTAPKKTKTGIQKKSIDMKSPNRKRKSNDTKRKRIVFNPSIGRKKSKEVLDQIKQISKKVETQVDQKPKKKDEIIHQRDTLFEKEKKEMNDKRKILLKRFQELEAEERQFEEMSSEQETMKEAPNLNLEFSHFVEHVSKVIEHKTEKIQKLLIFLQKIITKQLESVSEKKVEVKIFVYGSQATGLAIQGSDIDLLLMINGFDENVMQILQAKRTFKHEQIEEIKFISSASVPVIKLSTGLEFSHLKVDLTFQSRNHAGLRCTELIKSFLDAEIVLRPLVLFLKTLVHDYGLNDPYTGGIGSYGLTLMIIGLLQFTELGKTLSNLPLLLLQFFYFYGQQLDYIGQAIIIHPPGFAQRPTFTIYHLPFTTDVKPRLVIYDPLNPNNNVGRTTYRIIALKKLFSICYWRMKVENCTLEGLLDLGFHHIISQYS